MKRLFRLTDTPSAPRRDVADELRFHLDMRAQEFVEQGMSPEDARRAAAAAFGDVADVEASCRAVRERRARVRRWNAWRWDVAMDVRYALRTLRRNPLFTVAAVLTLALGIGGAAAVFTLVNGVLLRPLPYADPSRLAMVWTTGDGVTQWPHSAPNYLDIKAEARSLQSVAAFRSWPYTLAGDGGAEPEMLAGSRVAPELFATLGVRPLLGRGFTPDEARAGGPRVAVIGHELWQRRFGGEPSVVGRAVTLSGERYTIVGVMPPRFAFPRGAELPAAYQFRPRTELWTPLAFTDQDLAQRGTQNLAAVARLRPGVSLDQARGDLSRVARRLAAEYPESFSARMGLDVLSLKEQAAAPVRRGLLLLMGAVGCVLLIACANVANLLVARASARAQELAMRATLGATRGRVFLQLVVEGVLLATAGALLGLGLAAAATRALLTRVPGDLPRADDVGVDASVVAATLLAAVVAGVAFAAATALQAGGWRIGAGALGARATSGIGRRVGRRLLVGAEVALSLVLLVGAGLLARSFLALQRVEPGFAAGESMTAGLLMPIGSTFEPARDGPRWAAFFTEYADRLNAMPGIAAAGAVSSLPLSGAIETAGFTIEGRPRPTDADGPSAVYAVITPGYFRAMSIPLVAGRTFDARDKADAPRAIVVSESFARSHWPGARVSDVLGRRILVGFTDNAPHTIAGVVGDVRQTSLDTPIAPTMYLPVTQYPYPFLTFVARPRGGDAAAALGGMRRALAAIDPAMALHDVRPLRAVVDASLARQRFAMAVTGAFALAALLLAAVGLYGVIAYSVAQRTRELGVRMALGASPRSVLALVVGEGVRVGGAGVVVGLAGAFAAARLLRSQLYEVSATDAGVYAGVALLTVVVTLAASYGPARRATRVDPAVTLRSE